MAIYLDNAATSFPKPPQVAQRMAEYVTNVGATINRSVYGPAQEAGLVTLRLRERLCRLLGYSGRPTHAILTAGNTMSLNMILQGYLNPGDHCIVSAMEHNAVMRPLVQMGIEFDRIPCDETGLLNPEDILPLIRPNTKLLIMAHGFPNGYNTTAVKRFETIDAIHNGADEIDMVINLGWLREKKYDLVEEEIRVLKEACGDKVLKVIIEACLLTEEEKIEMCKIVTKAGADYIKTSTGFSLGGATREDIALFAQHVGEDVKIKAAGGIKNFDDANDFLALGADRLGTSSLVKLLVSKGE